MSDRVRSCVPARASLLAVVLVFTAMMSACQGGGSSSGSAAGPQQVTIKAEDTMRFDPASVTVTVGRPVNLTLMNDGALTHDFVLNGGVAQPVKIEAAGKSSANTTFTITSAGTYTFVCAQPGHEAAGMKGTIVAR